MKNFHLIEVTHHDIEKVKIHSILHNQTRIIEYNMSVENMDTAAEKWLTAHRFTITGRGVNNRGYIYITEYFEDFKHAVKEKRKPRPRP